MALVLKFKHFGQSAKSSALTIKTKIGKYFLNEVTIAEWLSCGGNY